MMRIWPSTLLGVVLLGLLSACELAGFTDTDNRKAEPPRDSIQQAYYEDARQLAVRKMAEANDLSVEIPDENIFPFYEALLAVYNTPNLEARDSIVGLHTLPKYNLREIVVGVDESAEWTEAWQNGNRLTGNGSIDDVMETYGLTLERYLDFDDEGAATLRSEDPLNPVGLSAKFDGITGVRYAEQNGLMGDGGDIQAEVLDEGIRLHYSRAWEDCPSGCIHRTIWTFQVGEDGTVSFEGRTSE